MNRHAAMQNAIRLIMADASKKRGCSKIVKDAMVGSMHNLFKGSGKLHADLPAGEYSDMVKWRFALTVVVNELQGVPGMKNDWYDQFETQARAVLARLKSDK